MRLLAATVLLHKITSSGINTIDSIFFSLKMFPFAPLTSSASPSLLRLLRNPRPSLRGRIRRIAASGRAAAAAAAVAAAVAASRDTAWGGRRRSRTGDLPGDARIPKIIFW